MDRKRISNTERNASTLRSKAVPGREIAHSSKVVRKGIIEAGSEDGCVRIKDTPKLWVSVEAEFYPNKGKVKISSGITTPIKNSKDQTIKSEFDRLVQILMDKNSEYLLTLAEQSEEGE